MVKKCLCLTMAALMIFAFACSKSDSGQKAGQKAAKKYKKSSGPYEGKLKLTGIENYGKYAKTIVLNDLIEIKNVQVKDGKYGKFVAFPRRKKKFSYAKIKRNAKPLVKALVEAIEKEKVETEFAKELEITDIKIKPFKSGKLHAFVEILIENSIWLQSFKIMDGKKGLWLAAPSQKKPKWSKAKGDYENIIYFKDKKFADKVQKAALDKFNKK